MTSATCFSSLTKPAANSSGFARDLRLGAALGLVRQVQVFQARLRIGAEDLGTQFVAELALFVDARQHGGAPVLEFAQVGQARFEVAQLGVVETAGDFLAVARDERNGGAFVEQSDGSLGLGGLRADLSGDGGGDLAGELRGNLGHCVVFNRCGGNAGPIVAMRLPRRKD